MEVDSWNGGYMEVVKNNEIGMLDELLTQTLTPDDCGTQGEEIDYEIGYVSEVSDRQLQPSVYMRNEDDTWRSCAQTYGDKWYRNIVFSHGVWKNDQPSLKWPPKNDSVVPIRSRRQGDHLMKKLSF